MGLGDIYRFVSDQVAGHDSKPKIHMYLCQTDYFRAPAEYVFMYISSSDYDSCFPISQDDYSSFLTHDSYISCGNLVYYDRQFLLDAKLKKDGEIKRDHLAVLHGHLANHDVMVQWEIGIACGALAAVL